MTNRLPQKRRFRSVSIFWLLPNMLTIAGFVSGLTALRFALDGRWAEGPGDGDRWHPDGACIKFRFTLSSGAYATTLLREFMMAPLDHLG